MWIGPDTKQERTEFVYFHEDNSMQQAELDMPVAMEQLFREVLANASDNVKRSRGYNVDPGIIEITMTNTTISIRNEGVPIPVEEKKFKEFKEKLYIPYAVFGVLRSSSTFDEEERIVVGRNGYGAKVTNVFSILLKICVKDSERHKQYSQTWSNNMREYTKAEILPYEGDTSSVEVEYTVDFKRFDYDPEEYSNTAIALFERYAIGVSFASQVKVIFNERIHEITNIRDFASLYYEKEVVDSAFEVKQGDTHFLILDTPECDVSLVNSLATSGGIHIISALSSFAIPILEAFNKQTLAQLTKKFKGKQLTAEKKKRLLSQKDLRPHVSVLISCHLMNTKFDSQSKTRLVSPAPVIEDLGDFLPEIEKWTLFTMLDGTLESKRTARNGKGSRRRRYLQIPGLIDANLAGTNKSCDCILGIFEGDSAKSYGGWYKEFMEDGPDRFGVFPMKGKCVNAMKKEEVVLEVNIQIERVRSALGLQFGMDYTEDENFSKLRYHKLIIMADMDVDGRHIIGLVLAMFNKLWPSLIKRNFISHFRSTLIHATKGKTSKRFYLQSEYDKWAKITDTKGWTIRYFKGLGTSDENDVKEDFRNNRIVGFTYDTNAAETLDNAFGKLTSIKKKEWIADWKPHYIAHSPSQNITDFINDELILYIFTSLTRAIPSVLDGLKTPQRKVIFGATKLWKYKVTTSKNEKKVGHLASKSEEITKYHHGDGLLGKCAIILAQNFVGSNNIPLLVPKGNFGNRTENNSAAAVRYLHTWPSPLFTYIFRKEDSKILDKIIEEGEEIEPHNFYPILPMALVNGARGIACGYSTFIPPFHPLDLVDYLFALLKDEEKKPELTPYFRNFKGKVELVKKDVKPKIKFLIQEEEDENTDEDIDEVPIELVSESNNSSFTMVTTGCYSLEILGKKITITELPIGFWTEKYKEWLEELAVNKKIKGFKNYCSNTEVNFEIFGFTEAVSIKNLRLKKCYSLTNMVLLDENKKPRFYANAQEIIEDYYKIRLPLYEKRRCFMKKQEEDKKQTLIYKRQLVHIINRGEIKILNTDFDPVYQKMDELKIPRDLFDGLQIRQLLKADLSKLDQEIEQISQIISEWEIITPKELWCSDLREFAEAYSKYYPEDVQD